MGRLKYKKSLRHRDKSIAKFAAVFSFMSAYAYLIWAEGMNLALALIFSASFGLVVGFIAVVLTIMKWQNEDEHRAEIRRKLRTEIRDKRIEFNTLNNQYAKGKIDREIYKKELTRIVKEIDELEQETLNSFEDE